MMPGLRCASSPRLAQHKLRHGPQVLECRCKTHAPQFVSCGSVAQLGLVAEREECFAATGIAAGCSDVHNLLRAEVGLRQSLRRLCKRAVMAHVPTQFRQGDKHLRGIRDQVARPFVAKRGRRLHEPVHRPLRADMGERFPGWQGHSYRQAACILPGEPGCAASVSRRKRVASPSTLDSTRIRRSSGVSMSRSNARSFST